MEIYTRDGPFGKIKFTYSNKYKDPRDGMTYAWTTRYVKNKKLDSFASYRYRNERQWLPIMLTPIKTKKQYFSYCKAHGYIPL